MTLFTFWQACEKAVDAVRVGDAQSVSSACEFIRPVDLVTILLILIAVIYIAKIVHREISGANYTHTKSYEKIRAIVNQEIERARELEHVARFGSLSQGLFHDLISPLTTISLSIESLNKNNSLPSPDLEKIISRAVTASQKMQKLMNDIRKTMSSSQSLSAELEKTEISIYEEALTAKDLLAYKARMMGVDIAIDIDRKLKLTARPLALHQIFMNLIANAIESYADTDINSQNIKQVVEVSAHNKDQKIRIDVRDYGCGMEPAKINKIYEKSYSTKDSNRGIGLWAVKSIVQRDLCGEISEKSTPGKGTVFTILIPWKIS